MRLVPWLVFKLEEFLLDWAAVPVERAALPLPSCAACKGARVIDGLTAGGTAYQRPCACTRSPR
jgi:hypothetical protein